MFGGRHSRRNVISCSARQIAPEALTGAMVQKMKKQLSDPCQGATPMIAWQGPVKKEGYEETLYQRQAAITFDG